VKRIRIKNLVRLNMYDWGDIKFLTPNHWQANYFLVHEISVFTLSFDQETSIDAKVWFFPFGIYTRGHNIKAPDTYQIYGCQLIFSAIGHSCLPYFSIVILVISIFILNLVKCFSVWLEFDIIHRLTYTIFSKEKMKTFKKLELSPSYLITNMNIKASAKFKGRKIIDNAWSIH